MTATVLLIDNYDSFTYNVVQALEMLGATVDVQTHELEPAEAAAMAPSHLVVSPGPGTPDRAGNSMGVIEELSDRVPILGICLGHQAVASVFGGVVGPAKQLLHGKTSTVYHDNRSLYEGLPNPFEAGRYHSLAVSDESLPDCLTVSSYTSDGEIMGVRHRKLPIEGVQFHPESILTPAGDRLLRNFLDLQPGKSA
ncbi:MAG: anthranilate synthase component II [Gemmatimonadales bacterium]